ncbi:pre-rRNA-processing protein TSR1 homolog [Culicoides brevitarsis]|uniref:pre-rRNA-processing protein TSR1 homolog n=1 Tax=Culicoides brevitarsis TaxID=469753 RepID=UPI00307C4673
MAVDKQGHRPGSLKQANKSHKHGGHRSKRSVEQANKGRVSVKASTMKAKRDLRRDERRHQATQIRKNKREEAIALKRSVGGTHTAPFLTCVLALHESIDPLSALAILAGCDSEAIVTKSTTVTHITIPRLKQRFSFIVPPVGKLAELQVLDYLKVCDSTILLISANTDDELLDKWGNKILGMASAQGIPTPMVTLMDLESIAPKRRSQVKANIQKSVSKLFPNEKAMTLDSASDGLNLLRRIGGQKRNTLLNKMNRPHMYAESVNYVSDKSTLQVTGFLRGRPLDVNGLVHVPGLGDYQLEMIEDLPDPYKQERKHEMATVKVLAIANPEKQTSLVRENEPDEMDADQPFPTEEEIAAAREETKKTKLVKRIPKGMSDYQAAWIPDIEEVSDNSEEDTDEEGEENEEYMSCDSDNQEPQDQEEEDEDEGEFDMVSVASEAPANDEAYDKTMDMDEEKISLEKVKAAQEEKKWPDEIDTPRDVPVRERYQKYRGLESFRTSPWDPKENLPIDYARIFQFQNFDRTKRRILKEIKEEDDEAGLVGRYIRVHIKNVDAKMWEAFQCANNYVIIYGLLPHEHQMSVANAVLKRFPGSEIPIKSKERLIIQCGYRRFIVNPIFSQHTNGDKHKYERFFRAEETVVATFYAPVQFPPAPVLCFMQNPNTTLSLVATGRLISCNPDRVILKRVVLSGHPFKIHRKTATIRYMFFNKEDIHYFKPCKLRTRCGRMGHIKESLGTHGHMKCVFDGPIKSFDTVFLNLYKRVFPKWTYEDCIVTCTGLSKPTESTTEDSVMQE